jgi:hypothetical protein
VDDEMRAATRELAEGAAERLGAAPYRPDENAYDAKEEAADAREAERECQIEQSLSYARAAVRERRQELAALGPEPVPPETPWAIGLLGALGMALSVTFTFHDLFFVRLLGAGVRALVVSFVCGAVLSGFMTFGLLWSARSEGPVVGGRGAARRGPLLHPRGVRGR